MGSGRYLILARYLVTIMIGYVVEYFTNKKIVIYNWKVSVTSIILILIISTSFINIKISEQSLSYDSNKEIKGVARYLLEEDFSVAIASYWNSSIIEGLTDGIVETGHINVNTNNIQPFVWLVDKKVYEDADSEEFKTAFILTDKEEESLEDGFLKNNLMEIRKKEIDIYNIYDMKDIKLDLWVGLPLVEINTDYPYSIGISTTNGNINQDGSLITNGTGGFVLCGPYANTKKGIYNFALHYEVIEAENGNDIGKFDVVTNSGEKMYGEVMLDANNTTVTIENVRFDGNDELLEYRVFANEGSKIKISKIEIERVE